MKKLLPIVVMLSLLISAPIANAQGFIFGLATGYLLFGDGNQAGAGNSASVMYTMAGASERVKQPLQMKQIAVNIQLYVAENWRPGDDVGLPLEDEFGKAIGLYNGNAKNFKKTPLKSTEAYEILQVIRLFDSNGSINTLLFTFIEKDKVIPLDQMQKARQ